MIPLMLRRISGRDTVLSFDILDFTIRLGEGNDVFLFIRIEFGVKCGKVETVGLVLTEGVESFGFLMRIIFEMIDFAFEH